MYFCSSFKYLPIVMDEQTREDIKKACQVLREGGVILYPTDTIWGLGCDASNSDAATITSK